MNLFVFNQNAKVLAKVWPFRGKKSKNKFCFPSSFDSTKEALRNFATLRENTLKKQQSSFETITFHERHPRRFPFVWKHREEFST